MIKGVGRGRVWLAGPRAPSNVCGLLHEGRDSALTPVVFFLLLDDVGCPW